jgi:hypothetical protein
VKSRHLKIRDLLLQSERVIQTILRYLGKTTAAGRSLQRESEKSHHRYSTIHHANNLWRVIRDAAA